MPLTDHTFGIAESLNVELSPGFVLEGMGWIQPSSIGAQFTELQRGWLWLGAGWRSRQLFDEVERDTCREDSTVFLLLNLDRIGHLSQRGVRRGACLRLLDGLEEAKQGGQCFGGAGRVRVGWGDVLD